MSDTYTKGYAIIAVLHDSTGKAQHCANCGATPAITGFARGATLPFTTTPVWHITLLCEACTHKALVLSGKLPDNQDQQATP